MGHLFRKGQNFSTGQNFYLAFKFAQTPRDYYPPYGLSCLKTDFWYLSFYLLTAYFFIWYPLPQISATGGPIDTKFFERIWDHARSKSADFARNAKTGSAPKNSDMLATSKKSLHWNSMGNRSGKPKITSSEQIGLILGNPSHISKTGSALKKFQNFWKI